MNFSPILIGVYNRLNHFERCIEALKMCPESINSILYVASDAAFRSEDEDAINKVRKFIDEIDGFQKVIRIYREKNYGNYCNYMDAQEKIFEEHDRLIVMEDDVIVGKGFLSYMNQGLNFYNEDESVVFISSHLPPNIESSDNNCFFMNFISGYGLGIWREKEKKLSMYRTPEFYSLCFRSYEFFKNFKSWQPNNVRTIPRLIYGGEKFYDIEFGIIMTKFNLLALYPPFSLSKTIGNDGTGLRAGVNNDLNDQSIKDEFVYLHNLKKNANLKMMNACGKFNKDSYASLLNSFIFYAFKISPIFCYDLLTVIRKFKRSFH
jgi:hypothetical protein